MKMGSQRLEGIGGWLSLIAIQAVLAPLAQLNTAMHFSIVFETKHFVTVFNESLGALWMFEMWGARLFAAVFVVVAFLFFTKKKLFPKAYIGTYLAYRVFYVVDGMANVSHFKTDPIPILLNSTIMISVMFAFVFYVLKSQRVKNTFIR